ncbi:MAG: SDR family NAD(P)-dependent oxidoreductase, partial [Gallionella sp.]
MTSVKPLTLVISGASSGIGLALARHYLQQGSRVAAYARRSELLAALAAEFPQLVSIYTC